MDHYTLSDAEMLDIFERIDKCTTIEGVILNTVIGTWDAILGQEGETWESYTKKHKVIPGNFGIPEDQMAEITKRMVDRLIAINADPIVRANAVLDWVNVQPNTY